MSRPRRPVPLPLVRRQPAARPGYAPVTRAALAARRWGLDRYLRETEPLMVLRRDLHRG